jgi:hypothetical protein
MTAAPLAVPRLPKRSATIRIYANLRSKFDSDFRTISVPEGEHLVCAPPPQEE